MASCRQPKPNSRAACPHSRRNRSDAPHAPRPTPLRRLRIALALVALATFLIADNGVIKLSALVGISNVTAQGFHHEWSIVHGPSTSPPANAGSYAVLFQNYLFQPDGSLGPPEVRAATSADGFTWATPVKLSPPSNGSIGDPFVSWDKSCACYRFVVVETNPTNQILFGTITSSGEVSFNSAPVMTPETGYIWDYPSVAILANGTIAVGAQMVRPANPPNTPPQPNPMDDQFRIAVSTNSGASFSAHKEPNSIVHVYGYVGPQSRIVATNTEFHLFVPVLHPPHQTDAFGNLIEHLPYRVEWHKSPTGTLGTWTSGTGAADSTIMWFWTPRDKAKEDVCSGSICLPVHTPPLLDARAGNNRWSVSFPVDYYERNNIATCNNETSPAPCAILDADLNRDQFLQGVSVANTYAESSLQDYWHSYYTKHSVINRLKKMIFYQRPGGGWPPIGYELRAGTSPSAAVLEVDPTQWRVHNQRCTPRKTPQNPNPQGYSPCWDGGDYGQIASTRNASAEAVYHGIEHKGAFIFDPPGEPGYSPNTIPLPLGADLRARFPAPRNVTGADSPGAIANRKRLNAANQAR